MRKRILAPTSFLLAMLLMLSACGGFGKTELPSSEIPPETTQNDNAETPFVRKNAAPQSLMTSVDDLRQKHAPTTVYEYTEPMYNLPKDYCFVYECAPAYAEASGGRYSNDFAIYLDSVFSEYTLYDTLPVSDLRRTDTGFGYEGTITIRPGYSPASKLLVREEYKTEPYTDWGNAAKYWLVQYRDTQTGEWYERPRVTVFTIKHELDAPTIHMNISDKGRASLEWDAVPGADSYTVYFRLVPDKGGIGAPQSSLQRWGEVDSTTYTALNTDNYGTYHPSGRVMNSSLYGDAEITSRYAFCVVAANGEKRSAISNIIFSDEFSSRLPYMTEEYYRQNIPWESRFAGLEDTRVSPLRYASAPELPAFTPVIMCDGQVIPKVLEYSAATYQKANDTIVLTVHVMGTELVETFCLEPSDSMNDVEAEYLQSLDYLAERQKQVQSKTVDIAPRNRVTYTPPVNLTSDNPDPSVRDQSIGAIAAISQKVIDNELYVYANTALSEYIAMNMLMGHEQIDVSMFKEAYDADYLEVAFVEAYRQNPLIGLINDLEFDYAKGQLRMSYDLTPDEIISMQTAVIAEVKSVVKQIISDGMTELEREMAINKYLCETAEYDYAALENAEKNNFRYVDKEFIHSFTPYGILINKIGVCASYAGAFMLLADAAGLDAVVVTGYLDGYLPHAWNRVYVDGYWLTVDATNNDMDVLRNALFNVPDRVASRILIEDNNYVYKPLLTTLKGNTEEYEYYRIENNYVPYDMLKDALVQGLTGRETFSVRTDYEVSESTLNTLLFYAKQAAGIKDKVKVYYWLGVITVVF